jgi:hypothetical protein
MKPATDITPLLSAKKVERMGFSYFRWMKKLLIVYAALLVLPYMALAQLIPDTGQTKCYDEVGNEINPCPLPGEPFYGQDAQYITNQQSYTKLDASGNDLPDTATEWVMVRDNVTELTWEVKTEDGSIHDKDLISDPYEVQDVFITTLNVQNFGGFNDWRLPTIKDLSFITNMDTHSPTINTAYFPFTMTTYYWSSSANLQGPWFVHFNRGNVRTYPLLSTLRARAVRGGQSTNNFIDNGNGTVSDTHAGLMWQQATSLDTYTWEQALVYCESLSLAGYHDWRLPNRNELQSLVDYATVGPSIDTDFFPTNLGTFQCWSSTTNPYNSFHAEAWENDFGFGFVDTRAKSSNRYGYVRAVRGGLCGLLGDSDGDTVCNDTDNCTEKYNPLQFDCDGDGAGDICDADTIDHDEDGIDITCDNCPNIPNSNQGDNDLDGTGDACDECTDTDSDNYGNPGFSNNTCLLDNCPDTFNPDQTDIDNDSYGDVCDNCPSTSNTDQEDTYPPGGNNIGDACDCECDFDCSGRVDANDVTAFLGDFGRSTFNNPCTNATPCNGDVDCNANVDALDVNIFLEDFGRSQFNKPCPPCVVEDWCVYTTTTTTIYESECFTSSDCQLGYCCCYSDYCQVGICMEDSELCVGGGPICQFVCR